SPIDNRVSMGIKDDSPNLGNDANATLQNGDTSVDAAQNEAPKEPRESKTKKLARMQNAIESKYPQLKSVQGHKAYCIGLMDSILTAKGYHVPKKPYEKAISIRAIAKDSNFPEADSVVDISNDGGRAHWATNRQNLTRLAHHVMSQLGQIEDAPDEPQ